MAAVKVGGCGSVLDDAPRARGGHRVFGDGLHRFGPRLGRPLTNLEGCLL